MKQMSYKTMPGEGTLKKKGKNGPFVCYILLFTSATLLFREWAVELVGGKGKSCRNG